MKTDKQFYALFQACPEMLSRLTHVDSHYKYNFTSVTFKEIERRVDGWLEPVSGHGPRYVVEIDIWKNERSYFSVGAAMAMAGLAKVEGPVYGRILFGSREVDPQSEPWASWARSDIEGIRVFYLDEELARLQKEEPEHLLLSILRPLMVEDRQELKALIQKDYHRIQTAELPERAKDRASRVFCDWLFQIFNDLSEEEIRQMLAFTTPLEETRAYRQIVERTMKKGELIGEQKGEQRGLLLGQIQLLQNLFERQAISEEEYLKNTARLQAELQQLETSSS